MAWRVFFCFDFDHTDRLRHSNPGHQKQDTTTPLTCKPPQDSESFSDVP